jgi:serine protease AprX
MNSSTSNIKNFIENTRESVEDIAEIASSINGVEVAGIEDKLSQLEDINDNFPEYHNQKEKILSQMAELLENNLLLIESFSLDQGKYLKTEELTKLRDSKNLAERMWRSTLLLNPTNEQPFQNAIWWANEKGLEPELSMLQSLPGELLYDLPLETQSSISKASYSIEQRIQMFKIFTSEEVVLKRFGGRLRIIQSHPAFTFVNASPELIAEVKKLFPVESFEPKTVQEVSSMSETQVVQFKFPVLEAWKHHIEELGASILQPLSRMQIVISVPDQRTIDQIKDLDEVFQVTPYTPKILIQPQYLQHLDQPITAEALIEAKLSAATKSTTHESRSIVIPGILIASFFSTEYRDIAAHNLEQQQIHIAARPGKSKLVLDLSSSSQALESVEIITKQVGLQSLSEKTVPTSCNEKARHVIGSGIIQSDPFPTVGLGLTGSGEIIAIADSGLDTGETETIHQDFRGRVRWINSYPMTSSYDPLVLNPGDNDGASDIYSGHGTHVAGSALGNGQQAKTIGLSLIPAGMAPDAELVFQAIEQAPRWNLQGKLSFYRNNQYPPATGLFGIPDDLGELFAEAYDQGARIHSNSWGGNVPGIYDDRCSELDLFTWENKDFLVVVAAGNAGKQSFSGVPAVDQGSVSSPGTAKNCLTVGASENNRSGQFSDTYFSRDSFPHPPFDADGMVDSIDDIAAFSSRGPCQNGRRHPDVIAPGTFVLSTRSSQISNNNYGWGVFPLAKEHYMYMGGTSMSTPLVAGCAALIRQYLREKHQPSMSVPSAALIKAIIIHSAEYIRYRFAHPSSTPWADNEQGWGRVNLQQVLSPADSRKVLFIDETDGLIDQRKEYRVTINDTSVALKITLVYTDYPGEELINNLNLVIYNPSGKYYLGNDFQGTGNPDTVNNVEGIIVERPEAGQWIIEVIPEVQIGEQDYALVISGGIEIHNFGTS